MSLEATMILLDNSSASINGDYYPTRWEAQKDFCQLMSTLKYNGNPESLVGVALQTGSQLILSAPTGEQTKIMAALHHVRLQGAANIGTSLSICQLALKHRLNKA